MVKQNTFGDKGWSLTPAAIATIPTWVILHKRAGCGTLPIGASFLLRALGGIRVPGQPCRAGIWGRERWLMQLQCLMVRSLISWLSVPCETQMVLNRRIFMQRTGRYKNIIFLLKQNGQISYFRGLNCEAICRNYRDYCNWQEKLCRWHFSLTEEADWLLNQPLLRRIMLSSSTIGYLYVERDNEQKPLCIRIHNKQTIEILASLLSCILNNFKHRSCGFCF